MALQYLAEISLLARRGITLQLASFWQRLLILKHEACWWAAYRPCQHTSVSLAKQHSFFTGRMPFLSPNQQCQSTEGKIWHPMDLLTPSSPGVFQLCLWPLIAPGYLGGGLPCLSSALWSSC